MEKTESVQDFYYHKFNQLPHNFQPSVGHFNVFRLEDCFRPESTPIHYSRREFYKILLIRGRNLYHYADKSIEISGTKTQTLVQGQHELARRGVITDDVYRKDRRLSPSCEPER